MKSLIKLTVISFMEKIFKILLYFSKLLKLSALVNLIRLGYWRANKLTFGLNFKIYASVVIRHPECVVIGNSVSIAEFVHIWGAGGVVIGDDTLIASHCVITSQTHTIGSKLFRETLEIKPVTIGKNVWIGASAIILPGITIGDGSVIGAGSVITKNVPEGSVVAGIPAKFIRTIK